MILLVLDAQKGITDSRLFEFEKVKQNIKELIQEARENHVEVIFIRHDDGPGSGSSIGDENFEIYEEFAPLPDEKIFDKTVNSAFHEMTGLKTYIDSIKEKEIMIIGLQTDYCMDATIKSGFEHGYKMIVPEYTNSTVDNQYFSKEIAYRFYNEMMWPNRYAKTVSMEEAIEMIRGRE